MTAPLAGGVPPGAIEWHDGAPAGGAHRRPFTLARDGRSVPGVLWTPEEGRGPWPLVLIGHGGSGSKDEDYVVGLGRGLASTHGMAAAAIDGPVHGDRRRDPGATPMLVIAQFAQLWAGDGNAMTDAMVEDWGAVLGALLELPELRSGPVGWWGVSMGTIIGLPFVAAEPRVRAAVLGLMGLTGPTRARIAHDAPHVRCPVLFLVQWDDEMFPRDDAFALWDALGATDARMHVHPGRHGDLPSEAFEASIRFLAARLRGAASS